MKYFLIFLLIVTQLAGFLFIIQHQFAIAIICFSLNAASLILLLILLVKERLKEKKEEEENDYRDY
ncbi:hypothetical protein [Bacillus pinisoli]|uniref:hypothetical protein n=1 Tax=Bacillus pinisoli TaxID=2901866 RepID=UPI001FF2AF06|nr:hypothetical protein [Bacillus pinisoli]